MNDDSTYADRSEANAKRYSFYFEGSPSLFLSTVQGIASASDMIAGEVKYGQELLRPQTPGMQVFPSTERLRDPNKVGVVVRPKTVDEKEGYLRLVGYAQSGDRTLVVDESQYPDRWAELRTWLHSELARDDHIVETKQDLLALSGREKQFADLVADGWTIDQITEKWIISKGTARSHQRNVTTKVKEAIGLPPERSMNLNELSTHLKSLGFGGA